MLLHATTVAWGAWHVGHLLGTNLPSLLAPGNLPALAKAHSVSFELVTVREDLPRIEAAPIFARLREIVDVHVRLLPPSAIGDPIGTHHRVWMSALERARRKRALTMFLPPDVIWSDGSLASVGRRISEGRQVLFNTYLRVASEEIVPELERDFRRADGSLAVPARPLVSAGFRHLHPLMACYLSESRHFPQHAEMIVFGVPGEGLLVRVLAREIFCCAPARFELNAMSLPAKVPDASKWHLFDDSDELCALSLVPLFKDHNWYTAPQSLDRIEAALWWLVYDSPINSEIWRRPVRYHAGEPDAAKWQEVERSSAELLLSIERTRDLLRLHRALRTVGLAAFARVLGEFALQGELVRRWDGTAPATLLVPTDRALAPIAAEIERASAERLAAFVLSHCRPGHIDVPAPWRADSRRVFRRTAEPPCAAGATLAGYGFSLGPLHIYPVDRPLAEL